MHNRRQHYRHEFPTNHRLQATVRRQDGAADHVGQIVNLSVGGMCVKLDDSSVLLEGSWLAQFALDAGGEVIHVRVERVHSQPERDCNFGLRFLFPIHIPTREGLERRIWKYLLDVQRYERQLLQEARKQIGLDASNGHSGGFPA